MQYTKLGGTGITVSRFALGAMSMGVLGNTDHDDCVRIVHAALDAGINLIDTADVYSGGEAETIVGQALAGRRDDVVLSSKCFWPMGADPNRRGGSRRWIVRAVEESLARLGTDRLDVYYLHKPDPGTDLEESLGALSDLVHQGKVISVGISTFPGSWITETQWVAQRAGLVRPQVEQPPYSIFSRGIERDVLPTCERFGMGSLVWGPLDSGWLTGKYRADVPALPDGSRAARWTRTAVQFDPTRAPVQRKLELVEALSALADAAGCSLTHLALAFCLEHPGVSSVILGPRTMEQLVDLLGAADLRLDPATLDAIDTLAPPGLDLDPEYAQGWTPPWLTDASLRRRSR